MKTKRFSAETFQTHANYNNSYFGKNLQKSDDVSMRSAFFDFFDFFVRESSKL